MSSSFEYYRRLRKLKRYAEEHISDDLSLKTAAEVVGLESKYFSVYFKDKTGEPYHRWIQKMRIEFAVAMFANSNYSVLEVSCAAGFGDVRTFQRAFKQLKGTTPSEYRRSVRPE